MKRCTKCNSQYSDLTLSFCLQDGTPLVEVKQSSIDTVAFAQPITAEKPLKTQNPIALPDNAPRSEFRYAPFPEQRVAARRVPAKRSRKGLMIGIISVLVLMIIGALGVFGWMYVSTRKPALVKTNAEPYDSYSTAPAANVSAQPTEVVANDEPADTAPPASPSTSDRDAIRREIASDVDSWKRSAETCNTADYATRYGEKVEYHDRHGVALDDIKRDVQKTCDTYKRIEIKIDNMVVAVDAEGDAATAIFDKKWRYEASPKLAQGKVHMTLQFRKITDSWKIVTEHNLKTYYSKG